MRKKRKQKKANKAKQFAADDFLEYGESPYKEHLENCIRISKSRRKRQRSKVEVMVTLSLLQFQWKNNRELMRSRKGLDEAYSRSS